MRGCTWLLTIGLVVGACGVGEPRIDTTSDETASASLKQVKESLPAAERERFSNAVITILMDRDRREGTPVPGSAPDQVTTAVLKPLDGKTAKDVFAEAERIGTTMNQK
jgi:hypothetical protein